ncbi:hypothetical protein V6N13_023888 [Hibiscus sabdariffa]
MLEGPISKCCITLAMDIFGEFAANALLINILRLQMTRTLLVQVLAAKYFPGRSILDATFGDRPSYTWHSIYQVMQELKPCFYRRVGIRSQVRILVDHWGGAQPVHLMTTYVDSPTEPLICDEFMLDSVNVWDASKVYQLLTGMKQRQFYLV